MLQGLGPRNDVLTTWKAVTLRGGQRIIAVFFRQHMIVEAISEPCFCFGTEIAGKLKRSRVRS